MTLWASVKNLKLKFMLDTGSQSNIITKQDFSRLTEKFGKAFIIKKSPFIITFGNGTTENSQNTVHLQLKIQNNTFYDNFIISHTSTNIIGLSLMRKYNIGLKLDDGGWRMILNNKIIYRNPYLKRTNILSISTCDLNKIEPSEFISNDLENLFDDQTLPNLESQDLLNTLRAKKDSELEFQSYIDSIPCTDSEKSSILTILNKNKALFSETVGFLSVPPITYGLKLNDIPSVICKPRTRTFQERIIISKLCQLLLEENILEYQLEPTRWLSEFLLVDKRKSYNSEKTSKNEFLDSVDMNDLSNVRLVSDLVKINHLVEPHNVLLCPTQKNFVNFDEIDYFISLDLRRAFWSLPLDVGIRSLFSLVGYNEHGEPIILRPTRTLQGFRSTLQVFHTIVTNIMNDALDEITVIDSRIRGLVYVDDLLICVPKKRNYPVSSVYDIFLTKFCKMGMRISLKKSTLGARQIDFLGRQLTPQGVRMSDRHIEILNSIPLPKTLKETQKFLATINFSRRFLPTIGDILTPVYRDLTEIKFNGLSEEHKQCFREAREKVKENITLSFPSVKNLFVIFTDASHKGLSGLVGQFCIKTPEGTSYFTEKDVDLWLNDPDSFSDNIEFNINDICFMSCPENVANNSTIHYLELLAIKNALDSFSYLLGMSEIIILSDSKNCLSWLKSGPKSQIQNFSKVNRLLVYISTFNLHLKHVRTEFNFSDFLSRFEPIKTVYNKVETRKQSKMKNNANQGQTEQNDVKFPQFLQREIDERLNLEDLRKHYQLDEEIKRFKQLEESKNLKFEEFSHIVNSRQSKFYREDGFFFIQKNKEKPKIYIPKSCVKYILKNFHDNEHSGINATVKAITKYFKILDVNKIVQSYVRSCLVCQVSRANEFSRKHHHNLLPLPISFEPSACLYMDIFHPFGQKRTRGIISVCASTNYILITPIIDESARIVSKRFLTEILPIFWGVKEVYCDSGPCFRSDIFKTSLEKLKIKINFTPPYRPNSNLSETHINFVKKFFRINDINEKEFIEYFRLISVVLNLRHNSKIGEKSPYELFFLRTGTKTRNIDEILRNRWPETTYENFTDMTNKLENREKRNRNKRKAVNTFKVNDKVIIYQPKNDNESFRIPFSRDVHHITKIRGPMLYLIDENKREKIRHFEHVVKIVERPEFLR